MKGDFDTRELAKASVLAALYAVASLIPISFFVGAQSFLSLSIVLVPVMSVLLRPREALISSFTGGLVVLFLNPGANMFGLFTILLPVFGATLGSVYSHWGKKGAYYPATFVGLVCVFYLFNRTEFPFWVIPHILMVGYLILSRLKEFKGNYFICSYVATITEQSMMLVFAVSLLNLPVVVFQTAFILMLYERLFATVAGGLVLSGLKRVYPSFLE